MRGRRWSRRVSVLVLAMLAALAVLAAHRAGGVRALVGKVLGYRASRARYAAREDEAPFGMLAASQVGYAPAMVKQFSAPGRFTAFQVVDDRSGEVVLRGGPPVQTVPVEGLGAIREVAIGDFSALTRAGRYHLVVDGGLRSHPFEVGAEVFDGPLRAVQRVFYFQRAFTAVDAAHARGPWVHGSDAALAPAGVRKGWHDAGDFSIYSASMNTALYWMLEAAIDFQPAEDDTGIPESGNGVPDLLDEARWGLEWLLSVQDASGGFQNTTCQDRYGPYGTNTPDNVRPYRHGEVGTLATARAVGTLAYASHVFRRVDPEFARSCLAAARRGEAYLRDHPDEASDGPSCPAYRADDNREIDRHVRMYAAAGLLLATGDPTAREAFERSYVELDYDPSYHHFNGFAAQLYLRAEAGDPARKSAILERLRIHADRARADGDAQPFQWAPRTHWGSIGAAFVRTDAYSIQACLQDRVRFAADCDQALATVHYALGRNYLHFSYVSGLPGVTHARQWAFHHWLAALGATPHDFPGMVAGGPNASPEPADRSKSWARPFPVWGYWGDPAFPRDGDTPFEQRYTDNDSWSTNEISLDWQAAALYGFHFARWIAHAPPASR